MIVLLPKQWKKVVLLETLQPPFVLKADGLAAGKGVLIIQDLAEAKEELRNMLVGQKFGAASSR
jgi:phosphoribosylamine--glycine ligase